YQQMQHGVTTVTVAVMIVPLHVRYPPVVEGTRIPKKGGRKAGRLNTRGETRNLRLRKIMDQWGPKKIRFEFNDRGTLMPLDDHASHWSNLLGEIVMEFPMHYASWHKIPTEQKAGVIRNIRVIGNIAVLV
ncbi:hypothetical protein Tco_0885899, partial [Tanacetum coccineum]